MLISGVLITQNDGSHGMFHYLSELEELQKKQYEPDIVAGHQCPSNKNQERSFSHPLPFCDVFAVRKQASARVDNSPRSLHQRSHRLSVRRLQLCAVVSDTYINELGLLQAECRHIIHWL